MTTILENSLVMAVLFALVLIPVFIIKRKSQKKRQALIQTKLNSILLAQGFNLTRTDKIGELLMACSDNRKMLLLNLIDFNHEVIDLGTVVNVQEQISYNGKEVKTLGLLLTFKNGKNKDILLYKQYHNNERELPKAKELATSWTSLLNAPV